LLDVQRVGLRRRVVVAVDGKRWRPCLAVPKAELGEIDAGRVLHCLHEIVTGDRLAVVALEVDPEERDPEDGELGVPVRPRRERGQHLRAVDESLQGQLEERVRVALDADHLQAVLECAWRVPVGDPAGDLVRSQETEPDRELAPEVRPPTGQDSTAG